MKKSFQLVALLSVVMLGACSGGGEKVAAEKVDEKPKVKLAGVTSRPVDQIQEYTATVEAEVKNNIAPSSPVRIDRIFVEVGDRVAKGQKLVSMDAASLKQVKSSWTTSGLSSAVWTSFTRWAEPPSRNGMPPR